MWFDIIIADKIDKDFDIKTSGQDGADNISLRCDATDAVLVDVEPKYYTLNPNQLEEVFSVKTRAIIAVHLYGQSANLDVIKDFCKI